MKKLTLTGLLLGGALAFSNKAYAQDDGWDIPPVKFPPIILAPVVPSNIENSVVCLRNTVIRENPAYDAKGNLYYSKDISESFGTGFIYMEKDGYLHVVTNHHVSCDDLMLSGGKKIKDIVEIVDDSEDQNLKDDILLEEVVSVQSKDIAILKVAKKIVEHYNKEFGLDIEVYKGAWGDSDTLKKGETVVIEGFPHALFQATTEGVVSNVNHRCTSPDHGWNHKCIVYDAATNPGNSGSPAFRKNPDGSLEWMGQVHAGYRAEGLKMFIAINEYKQMLNELKNTGKEPAVIPMSDKDTVKCLLSILKTKEEENLFSLSTRSRSLFFTFVSKTYCKAKKTSDNGLEFMLYTGQYPYDLHTGISLTDKKENDYGKFDVLSVSDPAYGRFNFEQESLPAELQQGMDRMFHYLTKLYFKTKAYREILNKEDKTKKDEERLEKILKDIEEVDKEYSSAFSELQKNLAVHLKEKHFERQKELAGK